jgi:Protein of unknown function (DUF2924)
MHHDGSMGLLDDLQALDRSGLKRIWEEAFGSPPALYLSLDFMRSVIAQERQVKAFGGLSGVERRALKMLASGKRSPEAAAAALGPSSGAQLVREWNGRTYRIEVLSAGYRFDGKTYRSLSSIAKRITGTNWSGPRFFGLITRRAARAAANET